MAQEHDQMRLWHGQALFKATRGFVRIYKYLPNATHIQPNMKVIIEFGSRLDLSRISSMWFYGSLLALLIDRG